MTHEISDDAFESDLGAETFLKLKKIIGGSAAIIFVAAWFAHGSLESTYVRYPQFPNPEEGRTVPYVVKGIVVYITQSQQSFLSRLDWIEAGSAVIAALVILIHRGDPFKSKD